MKDAEARRAVVALLARGLITPAEAQRLAGVSRQLMRHWIWRSGVDHERIRNARVAKLFRKEMQHGARLVERSPAETERNGTADVVS